MDKSRKLRGFSAALLVLAALGFVEISRAAPEDELAGRTITYTGYLEQGGTPVDGDRALSFRLFDARTGGTRLWPTADAGGTRTVPVSGGRFVVELGGAGMSALPDSAFSTPELWLSISVEGVSLGGRQRVGTSRHAIYANQAEYASSVVLRGPAGSTTTGLFRGATPMSFSGFVSFAGASDNGYIAARAACVAAIGSPTAHMCSFEEMLRSTEVGIESTVTRGWFANGIGGYEGARPINDCGGWRTSSNASGGAVWVAANGAPSNSSCDASMPILCCD